MGGALTSPPAESGGNIEKRVIGVSSGTVSQRSLSTHSRGMGQTRRLPPALRWPMRCAVLAIAVAASLAPGVSAADRVIYPSPALTALATSLQRSLFNEAYHAADSLADEIISTWPNDPSGYLFKSSAYLAEMVSREEVLNERAFRACLDSAERRASAALDTAEGSPSAWMHMYRGHAKAYLAVWESHFGSLLAAIRLGIQARDDYERGLAADSTVYDLYFGLGLFRYWKSAKAGLLRAIGLIKDEKARGIRELRLAADSSMISSEAARNALIWVWLDAGCYDSAIILAQQMHSAFPDGQVFLWPLAQAYFHKGQYRMSLATYAEIRRRISVEPGNLFNVIQCDYYVYCCLEELERGREAKRVARRVREYRDEVPARVQRLQREKLALLQRAART